MKKIYIIVDTIFNGYTVLTLKEYNHKHNSLIRLHPVIAKGTIKQLMKQGFLVRKEV